MQKRDESLQEHPFQVIIRSESSVKADGFEEAKRKIDQWIDSICAELDELIREIHEHKNPAYISDEDLARMYAAPNTDLQVGGAAMLGSTSP